MMHSLKAMRCTALRVQLALALVFAISLVAPPATLAVPDKPGGLIVKLAPGASIEDVNTKHGTKTALKLSGTNQVLVTSQTVNGAHAALKADKKNVEWVEKNAKVVKSQQVKKDDDDSGSDDDDSGSDGLPIVAGGSTLFPTQWAVSKISLLSNRTVLGSGVTIAVLDTRVDGSHPVLAGKTLSAIDLVPLDPTLLNPPSGPGTGHGTFVAGLASHVAPKAKVLPVRVLNENGVGSTAIVAEGVRRAVARGAKVINMSLSSTTNSLALADAVSYANDEGVVLVASYGNALSSHPAVYPADYPGVLRVVATDNLDVRATFSTYARPASVAAPGVKVLGPYRDGQYALGSGTSFAAAWVSGEAALLRSTGLDRTKTRDSIREDTDSISLANGGIWISYGRINITRALTRY
jgi:thermitase